MPRKKILFIGTGGTFAAAQSAHGLKPKFSVSELLSFFPAARKIEDIDGLQLFNLDSTNLQPYHWSVMAKAVADNYSRYDGFVIAHGTDTMAYSSSALSFALKGISKPVVFTGSVLPLQDRGSDAKMNFLDAVQAASSDLIKEVCICFHHEIIKGNHARKITNEATKITNEKLGVYSSINLHLVGNLRIGRLQGNKIYFNKANHSKARKFSLRRSFDPRIGLIKLFPGLNGDVLDQHKSKKAIVVEAYGPGNIPFLDSNWLNKIKDSCRRNVPVFVTTQNPFGEADMSLYEVGQRARKAGAICCFDMTTESALVKLMWIFGNYPSYSSSQVKKLFLMNLCGEIHPKK